MGSRRPGGGERGLAEGVASTFAGLRGATTLPAWRGRGIHRALIAQDQHAVARDAEHLDVDASPDRASTLKRPGSRAAPTAAPYAGEPPRP